MLRQINTYLILTLLLITSLGAQRLDSKELSIYPIEDNVWVHVTYLGTENWGRVACNGMIYRVGDEVVIFDTPITTEVSDLLINWVRKELKAEISAVIINHHHIDCLGGLEAFHKLGIPSYGHPGENALALELNDFAPKIEHAEGGLDTLMIGNQQVINCYPGPAHTKGSLISYLPETQTIFGGCQVKSLGAGKGNLNDADTAQWPISIQKVKSMFPQTKQVIPGHGKVGDTKLLDYTIELFSTNSN